MRNAWHALTLTAILTAAGCATDKAKVEDLLADGNVAIGGHRYDVAVGDADEVLKQKPSAEAHYLRARAEEDRPKPDNDITNADLAKARADYQAALDLHPPADLAARCEAGLANVAFTLEDYAGAISHWEDSMDNLSQPQWRALALYRIGLSQQRLGKFDDADKTFQGVWDEYSDLDVATMAKAREGMRGFTLELGTFSKLSDAETAIATAKGAGVECHEASDGGLFAVRGGPYKTYALARQAQAAVIAQFPAATIGP